MRAKRCGPQRLTEEQVRRAERQPEVSLPEILGLLVVEDSGVVRRQRVVRGWILELIPVRVRVSADFEPPSSRYESQAAAHRKGKCGADIERIRIDLLVEIRREPHTGENRWNDPVPGALAGKIQREADIGEIHGPALLAETASRSRVERIDYVTL